MLLTFALIFLEPILPITLTEMMTIKDIMDALDMTLSKLNHMNTEHTPQTEMQFSNILAIPKILFLNLPTILHLAGFTKDLAIPQAPVKMESNGKKDTTITDLTELSIWDMFTALSNIISLFMKTDLITLNALGKDLEPVKLNAVLRIDYSTPPLPILKVKN